MNEKSHVGFEAKKCVLCDGQYETGALLLDRRLRNSLDRMNVTGYGICDACKKRHTGFESLDEFDHVSLVAGTKQGDGVMRTGEVAFIRRNVAADLFNVPIGKHEFVWCDPEVIKKLHAIPGAEDRGEIE